MSRADPALREQALARTCACFYAGTASWTARTLDDALLRDKLVQQEGYHEGDDGQHDDGAQARQPSAGGSYLWSDSARPLGHNVGRIFSGQASKASARIATDPGRLAIRHASSPPGMLCAIGAAGGWQSVAGAVRLQVTRIHTSAIL